MAADRFIRLLIDAKDGTAAGINSVQGRLQGLLATTARFTAALGAVGVGLSFAALAAAIKNVTDDLDRLAKTSEKIGLPVEDLSALEHAAQQSGVEVGALETGLLRLNRSAADASRGLKEPADAFAALGVSVTDANGKLKSTGQLLDESAEAFARMADGPEKSALAMTLFGRAGADLIPMLNLGRAGLAEMRAEAEALGIVMDQETAEAAERFNDNLDRLQKSFRSLAIGAAEDVLPALSDITDVMVQAAKDAGPLYALFIGFGGAVDQLINGTELANLKKRSAELQQEIADIRQVVQTGILPAEQIPFFPFDLRLTKEAHDGFKRTLAQYEREYADIQARMQAILNPNKPAAADPRLEQERQLRGELRETETAYRKALQERIRDYGALEQAIVGAAERSKSAEANALKEIARLRAEAAAPVGDSIEAQASARLDLLIAQQKLLRLQSTGAEPEEINAQAEAVRGLAGRIEDEVAAREAVAQAATAQAKVLERSVAEERGQQAGLEAQRADISRQLREMREQAEALAATDATVKVKGDFAEIEAQFMTLETRLMALKEGVTIPLRTQVIGPDGRPAADLAAAIGQASLARGGRL